MIISVRYLTKTFETSRLGKVKAVDDVSFMIQPGQVLGLVGESGSGKTTLARLLLNLIKPDQGEVYYDEENIYKLKSAELKNLREKIQIIFQNPYASLNPRMRISEIIAEPLLIHQVADKKTSQKSAAELLEQVGLGPEDLTKFPHEFSAGQRQRIAIARALILKPEFLVLDEPVSSLDVTIQKQILELLMMLKKQFNLTFLFITHDIKIASNLCDQLGVMKDGRLVEIGPTEKILKNPQQEYTQKLLQFIL